MKKLLQQSRKFDQQKTDVLCPTKDIKLYSDGRVAFPVFGPVKETLVAATLEPFALTRLCQYIDIPSWFIEDMPGTLKAINLSYAARKNNTTCLFRIYGDRCRSVLRGDYVPLSNSHIIKYIIGSFSDYKDVGSFVDRDVLHLRLVKERQGVYYTGFLVQHSEIEMPMLVYPMLFDSEEELCFVTHQDGSVIDHDKAKSESEIVSAAKMVSNTAGMLIKWADVASQIDGYSFAKNNLESSLSVGYFDKMKVIDGSVLDLAKEMSRDGKKKNKPEERVKAEKFAGEILRRVACTNQQ